MKDIIKSNKFSFLLKFISNIIPKGGNDNKVKVLFLIRESALFHYSLYEAFVKDKSFNVEVFILPFSINLNIPEINKSKINLTKRYFNQKKIKYKIGYNPNKNTYLSPLKLKPDIIFYDNPHLWENAPDFLNPKYLSKYCITCYIPYGLMFIDLPQVQYNQQFHNDVNYIFSETDFHVKLFEKYQDLKGKNIVSLGYPKLDEYISKTKNNDKNNVWKINKKEIKKIIWAPHHSIHRYNPDIPASYFSTFLQYYEFMLKLAKENKNIEWIFKPHPLLYRQLIDFGEMDKNQADEYYNEWKNLSNTNIYEGGDYIKIFKESDAIILDSISFLSEYMFVNKPMLFLENPHRCKINEFGQEIMKGLYTAKKEQDINDFIENQVFKDDDPLKIKREDIVKNILTPNPTNAGEKIKDFLKNEIIIRDKNG